MPECQFRRTSYDDRDNRDDLDPAYGIHLHDPRMMEYMGAPKSARLLGRSPEYWLEHMGRDRAVAAALRLHHDASLIMTNIQVMSQFVTSLNRTASEVMRTVYAREPFLTDAVHFVTPGRRVRRAAHYMAIMGLWCPTSSPVFPVKICCCGYSKQHPQHHTTTHFVKMCCCGYSKQHPQHHTTTHFVKMCCCGYSKQHPQHHITTHFVNVVVVCHL